MGEQSNTFESREFSTQDGLRIFYREYGDALSARTPVLCLPGLTRNSSDFHEFGCRYAPERRIIAMDYRGRGKSEYDPDAGNYRPEIYMLDILHLLTAANLPRLIVIGTSLGGVLAMSLSAQRPTVLAGAVLNDIGPEIDPAGLARIKHYVASDMRPRSWDEAVDRVKEISFDAAPDFTEPEWFDLARRSFREDEDGSIRLDYDPALGRAFAKDGGVPNLWPLFGGLQHIPTLAIRGALSEILAADIFDRMAEVKPDLQRVIVPNRGHVPWLNEPECVAALDAFLAEL